MDPRRRLVGEADDRASAAGGVGAAGEEALGLEGGEAAVDGGGGGAGGSGEGGEGELGLLQTGGVEGEEHAPAGLGGEGGAEAFAAEAAGGDQTFDEAGGEGDPAVVGHPAKPLRLGGLDEPSGEPAGVEAQHLERRADVVGQHREGLSQSRRFFV